MKTKSEKQSAALIEFLRTLQRRPERFRWREKWTEPALHYWWRIHAYLLWRIRLYLRCGLGDFPGLQKMLRNTEIEARAARRAWQAEDREALASFRRSRDAAAEGLTLPPEERAQ